MKMDARVVYTLRVIRESFIKLLKEETINRITVKSLCDEAGINRATFYRYYEDVFDLYEQMKTDMVDALFIVRQESEPRDIESGLADFLSIIKENAEAISAFSRQNDVLDIAIRLCRKNYPYFDEYLERFSPETKKEDRISTYYYVSSGCVGVITEWMNNGMVKSEKEVASLLRKFIMNTVVHM